VEGSLQLEQEMRMLIGITTANRNPRKNYIGATLRDLYRSSPNLPSDKVHIFATAPDVGWFREELARNGLPEDCCILHVPRKGLTRNQNGLALLLGLPKCDWILHLEDDLLFCDDFIGSVRRWLKRYATKARKCYSFCTFKKGPSDQVEAWDTPRTSFGAVAVALRWTDAQDLALWVQNRIPRWRRRMPKVWRVSGFDMMIRDWAREPFLASNPSFVQHVGDESLTHSFRKRPMMRSMNFAGTEWRYGR
jgi:hypothetical protein